MTNWETCQKHAESILASGIQHLQNTPTQVGDWPTTAGNYLIRYGNQPAYIGEAKDLAHRLSQQTKARTSTFYKNYSNLKPKELPCDLNIEDFHIQTISHRFGRKEMEEFGIVNLPTCLNKFQKNKRHKFSAPIDPSLWSTVQGAVDKILEQGEALLFEQLPTIWFKTNPSSRSGLYYVERSDIGVIYIGESSSLAERHKTHSGKTYFSALRRHIGTELLGFKLFERKGKKRYFTENQDQEVTELLRNCSVRLFPVRIGRFELETYLIQKYKPILNRKDNY